MATTYEAVGGVRGSCGHKHRTIAAAEMCRRRDSNACASLGGGAYSDREVRRVDGEPLSDAEMRQLEDAELGMRLRAH